MRSLYLLLLCVFGLSCTSNVEVDRPNILWITVEDMSPVLGYLGDTYAITPNLDRLASESVIYTQAFATSPVCSPSRAALINGLTAPAQGTHQMRSTYPIPQALVGFPAIMREAGYYTTNNVKTDYNSGRADAIIAASFDENSDNAGWWGRAEGQPFFSIVNHMVTHQSRSMQWPYERFVEEVKSQLTPEEVHDPAEAPVPPYYPDTPLIRQTIARFYDCVTLMDKQVGALLQRLEDDGLAEDTIVFFFSDHGTGLPRHKRILLDSGMHVPLLVRFPEKYKHLAPALAGERLDRLVSFDDFGPSVLSLAGVDIPDYMGGQPFLGVSGRYARQYVFGHRDRIDEVVDMSRSVRDDQYLYVRHYMPHHTYNQQSSWPDQGAINHVFYQMAEGPMTDAQRQFAGPIKPMEALYDLSMDSLNLHNLAGSSEHAGVLDEMRAALNAELVRTQDLGFVPEVEMLEYMRDTTPYAWAWNGGYDVEAYIQAAEAVGTDDFEIFRANLQHAAIGVRYWGAMGYTAAREIPASEREPLRAALVDPSPAVQIEAATALHKHGEPDAALAVLLDLLQHEEPIVVLHATRAIELSADPVAYDAIRALYGMYKDRTDDPYLFIAFSARGYLDRVELSS